MNERSQEFLELKLLGLMGKVFFQDNAILWLSINVNFYWSAG
jgi:hypothetical protein